MQVAFLDAHRSEKVIVYFLTCACVEFYALVLKRLAVLKGLQVSALHGKLKQVGRCLDGCLLALFAARLAARRVLHAHFFVFLFAVICVYLASELPGAILAISLVLHL